LKQIVKRDCARSMYGNGWEGFPSPMTKKYSPRAPKPITPRKSNVEDVPRALKQEEMVRQRLIRLQSEIRAARAANAVERHRQDNKEIVRSMKNSYAEMSGANLSKMWKTVEPAAPEEVRELAELLNAKLAIFPDPKTRTWFKLFNHMDDDRSGRISFKELLGMVREELHLTPNILPTSTLQAVWRSLDADASGFIGAGEFGRFMRMGEPQSSGLSPRAKVVTANTQKAFLVRQELDALVGRDLREKLKGIAPAPEDDVTKLSQACNRAMAKFPDRASRQWFVVFKQYDLDASGRIMFDEFQAMVREELKIDPASLSDEEIGSVWRVMDADASGWVSAAEFGKFMRKGEFDMHGDRIADIVGEGVISAEDWGCHFDEKIRRKKQQASNITNDDGLARAKAAQRIRDNTRRLKAEAERLEQVLHAKPGSVLGKIPVTEFSDQPYQ